MSRLLTFGWALILLVLGIVLVVHVTPTPDDAVPFYCAGKTLALGADPYSAAPMSGCERAVWGRDWRATRWLAPAPVPPLAIAATEPLTRLSFAKAVRIWRLIIVLAVLACIVLVSRISAVPLYACAAALVPIGLIENGFNGQPAGLAVLCIVGAAFAVKARRDAAAAVLAVCALMEPHLGLPVCLALFAWRPASRLWLVLALAVGGALSTTVLPAALNVEYAMRVLPLHAAAEAHWYQQYSLTYLLTYAGIPDAAALRTGMYWYAFVALFSVAAAKFVADRTGSRAMLLLFPAAMAVLGGSFIHVFQMIAAVPAALVIAGSGVALAADLGLAAAFMIAMPWMKIWVPGMVELALLVAVTLAFVKSRPYVLAITFAAVLALTVSSRSAEPVARIPSVSISYSATEPAEIPYAKYITLASPSAAVVQAALIAKVPTWFGLALLAFSAVWAAKPVLLRVKISRSGAR